MSTVFKFIKAIASNDRMTLACKGFILEMLPFIDSKTLQSWLSVKGAADKTGRSLASVKRYRREMLQIGVLTQTEGWVFKGGSNMNPEQLSGFRSDPLGGSNMTPGGGSDLTPPSYKGITANNTANNTAIEGKQTGSADLDSIQPRFRPDMKDRRPVNSFSHADFSRQWLRLRGQRWGWLFWSDAVMPYLTPEERADFLTRLSAVERPNLGLAKSIINQIVQGYVHDPKAFKASSGVNVPLCHDDDEFIKSIH